MIVLHYTGGSSSKGTWRYFNRTRLEGGRKKLKKAGALNVLAHFIVDRDGTIYRLIPETTMGRHTIGLNHLAIGVENVGDGKKYKLTSAQVDANAALVRYLVRKHPITHLIGHHESGQMEGHEYWLELDPKYRNNKPDPGKAFMEKVRAKVADLSLHGPPAP
jgi:N-acetylmuramoyl-L-alanine amidase